MKTDTFSLTPRSLGQIQSIWNEVKSTFKFFLFWSRTEVNLYSTASYTKCVKTDHVTGVILARAQALVNTLAS